MAERFSLDLPGQHILAVRSDIATIKADVAAIRDRLVDHHQGEPNVVSGLAMRASGECVAWASMQAQHKKLVARTKALERQDR